MKHGSITIPRGRKPWPHELRVANILAMNGYSAEFLEEDSLVMADIKLDGKEFEIKSPFTNRPDKLERNTKRALRQSRNIIVDTSRIKQARDEKIIAFFAKKAKEQRQIKRLILITKRGKG